MLFKQHSCASAGALIMVFNQKNHTVIIYNKIPREESKNNLLEKN